MSIGRSKRWLIVAAAMALVATVTGCGFEAGPSAFEDQEIEDSNDGPGEPSGDELGGGGGAGTMAGTWLKVHQASSCVLGQEQVSTAYYLVEIEEDGSALREDRRLCHLEASAVLGFRPVASPETLASVQFPQVDRAIVTSLLPGAYYASSTAVGLWGIELDDPLVEAVPADPEDERVVDGEGDGNPGVTLELEGSGCERYMGQRQIVRLYGQLEAPNDVRGGSVHTAEVEVYGASGSVCQLAPQVSSNDRDSLFRMVRVDGLGGAVSAREDDEPIRCSDIEQFFGQVLELREPDDDNC